MSHPAQEPNFCVTPLTFPLRGRWTRRKMWGILVALWRCKGKYEHSTRNKAPIVSTLTAPLPAHDAPARMFRAHALTAAAATDFFGENARPGRTLTWPAATALR